MDISKLARNGELLAVVVWLEMLPFVDNEGGEDGEVGSVGRKRLEKEGCMSG
jgi:hypothetical protein